MVAPRRDPSPRIDAIASQAPFERRDQDLHPRTRGDGAEGRLEFVGSDIANGWSGFVDGAIK